MVKMAFVAAPKAKVPYKSFHCTPQLGFTFALAAAAPLTGGNCHQGLAHRAVLRAMSALMWHSGPVSVPSLLYYQWPGGSRDVPRT